MESGLELKSNSITITSVTIIPAIANAIETTMIEIPAALAKALSPAAENIAALAEVGRGE